MKRYSWTLLGFLTLLAGCPSRTAEPNYGAVKQDADQAQQDLNRQKAP